MMKILFVAGLVACLATAAHAGVVTAGGMSYLWNGSQYTHWWNGAAWVPYAAPPGPSVVIERDGDRFLLELFRGLFDRHTHVRDRARERWGGRAYERDHRRFERERARALQDALRAHSRRERHVRERRDERPRTHEHRHNRHEHRHRHRHEHSRR
jgi:hypothetical protein